MNSSPCPSILELFFEPPSKAVAAHLTTCRRCSALVSGRAGMTDSAVHEAQMREATSQSTGEPSEPDQQRTFTSDWSREELPAGTVVLLDTPESEFLLSAVVVRDADDGLNVIPLSDEVSLASEWDVRLPSDILGYPVIAEVWNHGRVLPEQVDDVLVQLPADTWSGVHQLLRAVAIGQERPPGLDVGPPIVGSNDPRLRFQDEETERVHSYWSPSLALAGVATLGELVAHRRREFGLSAEALEAVSLQRGWLDDLEHDRLDIQGTLTTTALASLMQRLQVGASRRLGRITLATIEAFRGGGPVSETMAFARRRVGYPGSSPSEDPGAYVSEFLNDLSAKESEARQS